ncbi:hypothetical protein [Noviherbaspirillum malthae]|jgi:hypothetical protein|uniref:hypothetical protein n=1 Tax=Noviherbaspirillum malthae TaxID=1260987 RepID=UPI001E3C4129|nr:hypothetical protein [Noviherbaspirillum malthae]
MLEAFTPLPAVAVPPPPIVLELLEAPLELPDALSPLVLVVVLLCALRTPVPPSAWRPAAKPLFSVVLVPALCACACIAQTIIAALAIRLKLSFDFISVSPV